MPGHRPLTYRDIIQAEAFVRDAKDENGEIIAVDHPEFYCTKVHGVHRAALPRLSDRDFTSFSDAEDALIARIDGDMSDEEIEAEDIELLFLDGLFCDCLYDGGEQECDPEYEAAWLENIEQASEDFASGTVHKDASDTVVVIRRRIAAKAPEALADAAEALPAVISPTRALLAGPKAVIRETGPDRHDWKSNTTNGRQFLRHA